MTGQQAASAMRRLADVVERYEHMPKVKAQMDENCQVGAAAMLCYIRDLFTGGNKEQFSRGEVLVTLNLIQHDPEIFTADLADILEADAEPVEEA